jgi:hypothetical protein
MDEELRADLVRWEQGELTTRDLLARYPKHQVAEALAAHVRARAGEPKKPPQPGLTWARGGRRSPPPDERRPAGTFLRRPLSVALLSLLLAALLAATVDPIQRGAAEAWRRVTSFLTGEEPQPEVDRRAPGGRSRPTQSPDTGRTPVHSRRSTERGLDGSIGGMRPEEKQALRDRRVSGRKNGARERRHASNRSAQGSRKKDHRKRGVSRDRHERDRDKSHPASRRGSEGRNEREAKQGGNGSRDHRAGTRYQIDRSKRPARARTQRISAQPSQRKSEAG